MTLPIAAIEIMRMRLTRAAFFRAVSVAATFTGGDAAIAGGWLDEIVEHDDVLARAQAVATEYAATLHLKAHVASKLKHAHRPSRRSERESTGWPRNSLSPRSEARKAGPEHLLLTGPPTG